jgi:hypothetical protein
MFTLPPKLNGQPAILPDGSGSLVVIGANGAGKTLFTDRICADLGDKAFRLSALDALYRVTEVDADNSDIDRLYEQSPASDGDASRRMSRLERVTAMIMSDELINLLSYKIAVSAGDKVDLPSTRLDSVIELWKKVFPGGALSVSKGKFLFSRDDSSGRYSAMKLSDGERAVLYYGAATLYAPKDGVIVIDTPEMFLHPTTIRLLWDTLEGMRPDCRFVYATHDPEFAASRHGSTTVWVRGYDPADNAWDYDLLESSDTLPDDVYMAIIGARRPVLFIEGDGIHSIDSKLYPLIFNEYTVKALGSCNRVIESTRTFNDLNSFHRMKAMGIVDRDRRTKQEVDYLRRKNIMVPEVAEIENMFMLRDVVKAVAEYRGRNPEAVFKTVSKNLIELFNADLKSQALQHTRHMVKRTVEYRIDGRFSSIATLEKHLAGLGDEINPRKLYDDYCRRFREYVSHRDYDNVLKVYNQKSMLSSTCVAELCGLRNKDQYIATVLEILAHPSPQADRIRRAVTATLRVSAPPKDN